MRKIKQYIKSLMPKVIWGGLHELRHKINLLSYYFTNNINELNLRRNKDRPLHVLFFALWDNNWKYDSLFKKMLDDPNFEPLIIICPVASHGREYMLNILKQCCNFFEDKGYPYICSYDNYSNTYVDVQQYNPDIIFYTSPYSGLIDEHYRREKFKKSLICYANYFYVALKDRWGCALDFHQSLWRYYLEYPLLLKQINDTCRTISHNGKVVGYPLFDSFRQYVVSDKDWPLAEKKKKRIIWAPHHSISGYTGTYALSTFEKYYNFMVELAKKYINEIEIVFKPHPLLKPHLYEADGWGKHRADAYYEKWEKGTNTALVEGEYIGLFLSSDAMIHDCNSFTIEYLAVNKPAMFLDSGMTNDKLNMAGKEARECYYKGYYEEDIERFIQMIIEGRPDELKERREAFYEKYILPPNGKLAAENIIDDLLTSLGRK